jgi:hypothetical protein
VVFEAVKCVVMCYSGLWKFIQCFLDSAPRNGPFEGIVNGNNKKKLLQSQIKDVLFLFFIMLNEV